MGVCVCAYIVCFCCFSFNTFGLLIDTNRNTKFYRKIISNHLLLCTMMLRLCALREKYGFIIGCNICVREKSIQSKTERTSFRMHTFMHIYFRWRIWMRSSFFVFDRFYQKTWTVTVWFCQKMCSHCTLKYKCLCMRSSFVVAFVSLLLLLLSLTPNFRRRRLLLLFM